MVSTPSGDNVRVDRVYKDYPIVLCGRTMCPDMVELPMNDFDIILCMDWLRSFYACVDYRSRVVRFYFLYEVELVYEGYNSSRSNPLISNVKANKMTSKGSLCHLLSVNDLDHVIPSLDLVPLVNLFPNVFPDYLS